MYDDDDDHNQDLEHFGKCPKCDEGEMFVDPEDMEEQIAFCTSCGYVRNLDPLGLYVPPD
ncbi:MAG: hypothetical protein RMY34_25190 [Aulosira sp. DedQUE10]|nr:hypothetical protein [Aulosira sp. DedQUE10]